MPAPFATLLKKPDMVPFRRLPEATSTAMAPMQSTSPPLSHSDLTSPSPASPQTLAPSPITGDDSGDEWELLTSDPKHEHSSNDAVDVDPNINDTSASIHEAGVTAVQSPLSASAPGLPNACPCGTESDDLRTLRRKVRLATPVDDIILCVGEDEKKDHDGLLGYGKPLDSDGGSSLPKHLGEFEEDRRQTYTFPALKSNPIFDILQPLHDESERTETKSDKPVRSIVRDPATSCG